MANCIDYLTDEGLIHKMNVDTITNYIIEEYQGTCDFLSSDDRDWLENNDQLQVLDNTIFECEACGWWCEAGDEGESEDFTRACSDCCE